MFGRYMNNVLGHLHFWPSLIFINLVFFPMLLQGMAGFHRRWYNGGDGYLVGPESADVFGQTVREWIGLNQLMSISVFCLAAAQIPFIINLFTAWRTGKKVESDNPWNATTLEWATPTPPGHGNFTFDVAAYRGPYEYSRPDCEEDFYPQWHEPKEKTSSDLDAGIAPKDSH
jgi:cytochrome c oxidase subunit 1